MAQTLPRRDANILVNLGPMFQVLQIAGTLPRVREGLVASRVTKVTIHGGKNCAIFDGFPGNLCL